ncbi:hypothetical protein GZ77_00590 [Endozoicomonas montiporae]|uniref:Penicillin-binding protein transpeptidase domain-containing protein n=1 Tax=Endozoicomonas montiporae TaxID=1027273 RepID=A0A081N9U8_9GAMM|nr:penicillin-binding transpeptidase domain-containing protein [Endozoicomonas montiporae]KEQ15221.1 hypothetical protein GZ77_00590 [Endozoicomonas montiporae]
MSDGFGTHQYVFNRSRAEKEFAPACTFQIANALIVRENNIVKNPDTIICHWDGKEGFIPQWNKDQSARTAFHSSVTWCFQELQNQIVKQMGAQSYLRAINKTSFSKEPIDPINTKVDRYLDLVSQHMPTTALNEVDFVRKVFKRQLPYAPDSYDFLAQLMLEESGKDYRLYSKTGALFDDQWQGHAWYTGYVTTKDDTWFFSTNLEVHSKDDLAKRMSITREALSKIASVPLNSLPLKK